MRVNGAFLVKRNYSCRKKAFVGLVISTYKVLFKNGCKYRWMPTGIPGDSHICKGGDARRQFPKCSILSTRRVRVWKGIRVVFKWMGVLIFFIIKRCSWYVIPVVILSFWIHLRLNTLNGTSFVSISKSRFLTQSMIPNYRFLHL